MVSAFTYLVTITNFRSFELFSSMCMNMKPMTNMCVGLTIGTKNPDVKVWSEIYKTHLMI